MSINGGGGGKLLKEKKYREREKEEGRTFMSLHRTEINFGRLPPISAEAE